MTRDRARQKPVALNTNRNEKVRRGMVVRTALRAGAVAAESDQFAQVRGFKLEIT